MLSVENSLLYPQFLLREVGRRAFPNADVCSIERRSANALVCLHPPRAAVSFIDVMRSGCTSLLSFSEASYSQARDYDLRTNTGMNTHHL